MMVNMMWAEMSGDQGSLKNIEDMLVVVRVGKRSDHWSIHMIDVFNIQINASNCNGNAFPSLFKGKR